MPLACPRCFSRNALSVQAVTWVGINRDGSYKPLPEAPAFDWNGNSRLRCVSCQWEGSCDAGIDAAAQLAAGDLGE